jgi:acyl dehydratase
LDLQIGQKAHRELTVTESMVCSYAEITGDYNPLHFDAAFACKARFGGLIAQGGIATGLLHALVAMDMPGPGRVFTQQRLTFPKPVYIGDTLNAEATVTPVHARLPMAELRFVVTNQDGVEVLTGIETVYQAAPAD